MSWSLTEVQSLTERANAGLAQLDPADRPRIVVSESADLKVRRFEPLHTSLFSQYVDETPWLEGEYQVDALEAWDGTRGTTVRIAAILPVRKSEFARKGYLGVFLNSASALGVMGKVLEASELPDIADVPGQE